MSQKIARMFFSLTKHRLGDSVFANLGNLLISDNVIAYDTDKIFMRFDKKISSRINGNAVKTVSFVSYSFIVIAKKCSLRSATRFQS